MPTYVSRRAPGSPALSSREVRRIADRMLAELGLPDAELSVLFTDDGRMTKLNERHRNKPRPTDVLAFPQDGVSGGGSNGPHLLGDVVISLDTAARQAKSRGRPLLDEVRFLLAHGVAHLLGHDHQTATEKREMDRVTRRLVRAGKRA